MHASPFLPCHGNTSPSHPGWGAAPAAPTSAYHRHAPSLRETTTTTASTEKFSGQPVPVPPVGWDSCKMPGATGHRLSNRERCHGCSIPPASPLLGRHAASTRRRCTTRRQAPPAGKRVPCCIFARLPGPSPALPALVPQRKKRRRRHLTALRRWRRTGQLSPARRLSPPAPSPAGDGG